MPPLAAVQHRMVTVGDERKQLVLCQMVRSDTASYQVSRAVTALPRKALSSSGNAFEVKGQVPVHGRCVRRAPSIPVVVQSTATLCKSSVWGPHWTHQTS